MKDKAGIIKATPKVSKITVININSVNIDNLLKFSFVKIKLIF